MIRADRRVIGAVQGAHHRRPGNAEVFETNKKPRHPAGKWLNLLRESAKIPVDRTDETDNTDTAEVSSVLSVRLDGRSKTFAPDTATGSVSFVSSPNEPFQNFRAFNNRSDWDGEDWQVAFHERAAILEFDQGMPREEAETLARHQIAAERKRWLQ